MAPLLRSLPLLILSACAADAAESEGSVESDVSVAPAVIVASTEAVNAAETLPDSLRIPVLVAKPYLTLQPGTVIVGARGAGAGKNPEGFLRRIVSSRVEGDTLVLTTTNATLTDAIVKGSVRASSGGSQSIDDGALSVARGFLVDLDFSDKSLFENVDEIQPKKAEGEEEDPPPVHFTEKITFDQATLQARTSVDVDLKIQDGRVSRFVAKVEGTVDARVALKVDVTSEDTLDAAIVEALRGKKHEISKVLYQSPRNPLPTFAVGSIPVSTAVQLTVTMKCSVGFGGPVAVRAGFEAGGGLRLAALNTDGVWAPPSKSDLTVEPSFEMTTGGELTAKCALETETELSAYGMPGVKMNVAPYVDFGATPEKLRIGGTADAIIVSKREWNAAAGITGALRGNCEVFGLTALDQELAHWTTKPLRGLSKD